MKFLFLIICFFLLGAFGLPHNRPKPERNPRPSLLPFRFSDRILELKGILNFDLVISRCAEPINELSSQLKVLDTLAYHLRTVFLYSMCEPMASPPRPNITMMKQMTLPHSGGSDYAYAHHIAHHYDDMAPHVVFVSASQYHPDSKGQTLTSLLSSLRSQHFSCATAPTQGRSVWHLRQKTWQFGEATGLVDQLDFGMGLSDPRAALSICGMMRAALSPTELLDQAERALIPVCYGRSFAADSSMIRGYAQTTWQNFEKMLFLGAYAEQNHPLERAWAALLSPKLSQSHLDELQTSLQLPAKDLELFPGALLPCPSSSCHLFDTHPSGVSNNAVQTKLVIIAIHHFGRDGAPYYALALGIELKRMGFDVVVISPEGGSLEAQFIESDMRVMVVGGLLSFPMSDYFDWLDRQDLHPVYVFWNCMSWLGTMRSPFSKYTRYFPRMIWIIHESSAAIASLNIDPVPKIDAMVFVAEQQLSQWNHLNPEETFLIPGYPRDYSAPSESSTTVDRRSLQIPEDAFVISLLGTFCPRKRQMWLFDVLDHIQSNDIDVRILLIGYSDRADFLEYAQQVINKANLPKYRGRVIVVPSTPHPADYLRLANLHVSASSNEAYPLNVIEAMSLGLPVVATDVGGTREIYTAETNDFLVKSVSTPNELISKVNLAIEHFQAGTLKQLGQVFRNSVSQNYQKFIRGVAKLMEKLQTQIDDLVACKMIEHHLN